MRQHLGEGRRDGQGVEMVVDKAVGGLRPLHDYVRTLLALKHNETAIKCQTRFFEYPHNHLDTCLAQLFDASPLHFGKGVDASHHHTRHAFADDKVGTGGRFAVMRTGFETYIKRGVGQKRFVFGPNGGKSVHLCVAFAAVNVVAFADNAVVMHDYRPHHRIGLSPQQSATGQL